MKEIVIEGASSDLSRWLRSHLPEGQSEGRVTLDARFTAKVNPPEIVHTPTVDAAHILCALIARGIVEDEDIRRAIYARIDPAALRATREDINRLAQAARLIRKDTRRGKACVAFNGKARID